MKHFLTIKQQSKTLNKKGIKCLVNDETLLCQYGYFNIINGCRDPFTRTSKGKRTYLPDTSLKELSYVYMFDTKLQGILLKAIIQSESMFRSLVAYKFSCYTKSPYGWDKEKNYDKTLSEEIINKFIKELGKEIKRNKNLYIVHYHNKKERVPIWACLKACKFSTLINFVDLLPTNLKDEICNFYQIYNINGKPDYKLLKGSLNWMREIRNITAHGGRVFMAKSDNARIKGTYFKLLKKKSYSKEKERKIIDLIIYLKYYLTPKEYEDMVREIKSCLMLLKQQLKNEDAFNSVRASTGIKELKDLDTLLLKPNVKHFDKLK